MALGLSGVTALGPLPNLGAGGEATIAYRPWRLRFEAGGAYWAPQTETPSGQVSASADFSLVSIVGRVGYTVSLGAFELVPSLMAEADFMEAEAKGGVTTSIPASATWFALGGGGWVFWALTREIALRLGVEAALPFTRPYFEVTHGPEVFKPGVISAKGAIGLELRFL